MEEWIRCNIGDVCDTISDTYRGDADKVVLVNTSDVLDGKCLNHQKSPNKDLKGQFKKTFQRDDILYSEIRPANKRFAYIDFDGTDYIASTKLMVIRHKENIIPQFLYYIITSQAFIEELQMLAESRSGTFPQITFTELANQPIELPPLSEQAKIVRFLKSLDDKIEVNRRINDNFVNAIIEVMLIWLLISLRNDNLEQQAQSLFKSWFVDFEPFKNQPFVESELGLIPKGWRVVAFKDFIEASTEKASVDSYPEYSVTNNGIIPRETKFKKKLSKSTSKNKVLRKDNLVFGMSREILNWGIMEDEVGGVSSAYNIYAIDKDIVSPTYLRLYMRARKSDFNSLIGTAAREGQSLDKGHLLQKQIYVPTTAALQDFFRLFIPITEAQLNYRDESRRIAELRDTILPRLMSGEFKIDEVNM